jgi:hypothetical protein
MTEVCVILINGFDLGLVGGLLIIFRFDKVDSLIVMMLLSRLLLLLFENILSRPIILIIVWMLFVD